MVKKNKDGEDGKKSEFVLRGYRDRLKTLRRAQEFSQADEIPKAVECYSQYLSSLASYHGVEENKLKPELFDQEKDIAELLLISHVYWDLAKAYDRSPKLNLESIRCLDQFVKFTIGYKYQNVNARMVKQFIKKRLAHNPKAFKQAYERIRVEGKGCFIATYTHGNDHFVTNDLRIFKNKISSSRIGKILIENYYRFSPMIIQYLENNHKREKFIKPFLTIIVHEAWRLLTCFGFTKNVNT